MPKGCFISRAMPLQSSRFLVGKKLVAPNCSFAAHNHLSPSSEKTRWQLKEVSFKHGADQLLVL